MVRLDPDDLPAFYVGDHSAQRLANAAVGDVLAILSGDAGQGHSRSPL